MGGGVDIVVHGDQSQAMLPKLKAVLDAQEIAYQESEELSAERAAVFVTSDKDHCEVCGSVTDSEGVLEEAQGYVLTSDNSANQNGQVTITGADADGAYYGVLTLQQLLEQKDTDGMFAKAEISDYPSIKLRGFVEGFYGYPWSFEDRMSLIEESAQLKMNTYIYAPKDDPYHKDRWKEPYPEEEAEHIRRLVEQADKNNLSFCWNVHPGYGFNYSNDNDYNALIAKFEQLYSLGVRQFGISYDDLEGGYSGENHKNLINKVDDNFVKAKGDVKPLIVVGTRYCNAWGASMTGYFRPLISDLHDDIVIMWTGQGTMSEIKKDFFEWPKQQTGVYKRNLAAWWNYPVNDYCDGNLMMAPLENLDTDVDNLSGFFLNPMSQADASKVAIFSGADYSWNVTGFEYMKSWKTSIQKLAPEANEAFERFADNISYIKDGFEFDESRYLEEKITALTEAFENKSGVKEAAEAMKAEFEVMHTDVTALRSLHNANLQEEINPFLGAYDALALAGVAGMDAIIAAADGSSQAMVEQLDVLEAKLEEAGTFTIESLEGNGETKENVVKVGEKRIKPLLSDISNQAWSLLMSTSNPEVVSSVFSNNATFADKEVAFTDGVYSVAELGLTLEAGGYVGFSLPALSILPEISLNSAQADALEIQYSVNGVSWETAETEIEQGETPAAKAASEDSALKTTVPVLASYVRAVNKGASELAVTIRNFNASTRFDAGRLTASTNLRTYENYNIQNAVDGNMATKFYSYGGANTSNYIRVDMEHKIPLYDLKICYAVNPKGVSEGVDGFAATKLEISADGTNWEQIGSAIDYVNYDMETIDGQQVASVKFNAGGKVVNHIRFSAAKSSGNWVQVYEVLYNQNPAVLAEASFDVYDIGKLYDSNFSTAVAPDSIEEGDYLTYKLTSYTNVESITVLQDAEQLCGAKVSVKNFDGTYSEIGALDERVNIFEVNNSITEVKFSFDPEKPLPCLYEILVKARDGIDKSGLDTMIEKYSALKARRYTEESWRPFKAALEAAKKAAAVENPLQIQINAAAGELADKYNALEKIPVLSEDIVKADIYPTPHKLTFDPEDGMAFDGKVTVVSHGTQTANTLLRLKETLEAEEITYEQGEQIPEDGAVIFITSDKDHCEVCSDVNDREHVLEEEQGYVLTSEIDTNPKGKVTITGADEEGAYYGVLTLQQILDQKTQNGGFAQVTVYDYPSVKLRGIVEGFYGFPWSYEDRLSIIQETSKLKMNTYIYAPKDDPYHKDRWREPYPEEEAEKIRQLAEEADKNNMSFCWNVHPGNGYNYNTDADFDALIAKFEQLYELGVRQFGVSYDDLASGYSGPQHVSVINRVDEEFVKTKSDVKPLIVVGTRYANAWGPNMQTYFKPFLRDLHEDVVVMWTGAETIGDITREGFEWPKEQTQIFTRDLAAWWNYPTNDYCFGNLMMAPLEALGTDVDNISGFFLNPMSQADASKVAVFSGADYSWNVADFKYMDSWKTSIQRIAPEANEEFERFADNISYIKMEGLTVDESRYLQDKMAALDEAVESGEGTEEAIAALKEEFNQMQADVAPLRSLKNEGLQEEINPFLDAYEVLAQAGTAGMEALEAASAKDHETMLEKLELLSNKLKETQKFTVDSLERDGTIKKNIVKVGEHKIKPLLETVPDKAWNLIMAVENPEVECGVFWNNGTILDKDVVKEEGVYSVDSLQVTLGAGGYVGFNLPCEELLTEISLNTAQADALELQYSLNGTVWETVETVVEENTQRAAEGSVLKTTAAVIASSVRVVNTGEAELEVAINDFAASTNFDAGSVTASTNMGTYGSNPIQNAVDGDIKTKYYSSDGSRISDYVRADFENTIPLFDVKICYAVNPKGISEGIDAFAATKLEISTDGTEWEEIGSAISYDKYVVETIDGQQVASVKFNAGGKMARHIRFSATQSSGNWVQVHEIYYNKQPSVLAEASFAVDDITNLYDSDYTTAVTADSINEGDYLIYKLVSYTNIESISLLQDAEHLCGAAVSVKKTDGTWEEVGSLDDQLNVFEINGSITEIKLSFDPEKPLPCIYELVVRAREGADIASLQEQIAGYEGMELKAEDYTEESWNAYQAALDAAKLIAADENALQVQLNYVASVLGSQFKALEKPELPDDDLAQAAVKAAQEAAKAAEEARKAAESAQKAAEASQAAAEDKTAMIEISGQAQAAANSAADAAAAAEAAAGQAAASLQNQELMLGMAEQASQAAATAASAANAALELVQSQESLVQAAAAAAEAARDTAKIHMDDAKEARDLAQQAAIDAENKLKEAIETGRTVIQNAVDAAKQVTDAAAEAIRQQNAEALKQAADAQAEATKAVEAAQRAVADFAKETAAITAQVAQAAEKAENAMRLAQVASELALEAQRRADAAQKAADDAAKRLAKAELMIEKLEFKAGTVQLKKVAGKKKSIALSWKKVSGALGYEISYATRVDFGNAKKVSVKNKQAVTIKKLKANKRYYVRVRAYKKLDGKKVYTRYCGKRFVKTK